MGITIRLVTFIPFQAIVQKAKLQQEVTKLKQDIERLSGGPFMHCLKRVSELETLPLTQLKNIQQQLRLDLDRLDKVCMYIKLFDSNCIKFIHSKMQCMVEILLLPNTHFFRFLDKFCK